MNGEQPRIEIFAPFGVAFEWMKTVLFRPFDFVKWLTIAFAAFLAGSWGGSFNPGRFGRIFSGDFKYHAKTYGDVPTDWQFPNWAIGLVIAGVVFAIILAFVFMWIAARGRFIYSDCVVRNRGAIVEPWREYRREGNSFFLFSLAVTAIIVAITLILVLAIVVPMGLFSHNNRAETGLGITLVLALIVLGLIWLVFMLFFALISQFMVPVMYRRRCAAREAFVDVAKLILNNPGPFILFVLFGIVLGIAVAVVGTLAACLTCCIGALPYVSAVLLLPAFVWLMSFKLLFLRQFGDQYDVWATTGFPQQPVVPPTEPPPAAPLPPPATA